MVYPASKVDPTAVHVDHNVTQVGSIVVQTGPIGKVGLTVVNVCHTIVN